MIQKKILFLFCILIFQGHSVKAQGFSASNLWVGQDSELYIGYTNTIMFGSGVETDKSIAPGIISFKSLESNTEASGLIDGYVRVYNNTGTVYFPVGDEGVWHINMADHTTGFLFAVEVLDVNSANQSLTCQFTGGIPDNPPQLSPYVSDIAPYGSWTVQGNTTGKLRVLWNGATLETVAEDISELRLNLAAWDTAAAEWILIPAQLSNGADWNNGTLTSLNDINYTQYTKFTIVKRQKECLVIVDSEITTTWDGSTWSNGAPDEKTTVLINGPLTVNVINSFTANSLVLNNNIAIEDGAYIELVKGTSGTGTIAIASEGSFVQRAGAENAPGIVLTKVSRPLRKYDYVYWGTPIAGNFNAQIPNAKAQGYAMAAFDVFYKYVSELGTGGAWQNLDAITTGKGFITRIKAQPPFINETATAIVEFPMVGTANNGDVVVTLGSAITTSRSYNLLANPYPSALDAEIFLRENENLGGAIYLWTANEYNSSGLLADYATWTLAGAVAASPIDQQPTGKIASGQSFMVKGLVANGSVTFTNCMRTKQGNDNFFRSAISQEATRDRYWLNLTNAAGAFSQILVNYTDEATYGYDRLFDAQRNSVNSSKLYSFIGEDKYAINSRPEFVVEDVVAVGISRITTDPLNYTIAIDHTEGVFSEGNVILYLHDLLTGTYHNLNQGPYNFSISDIQVNDRFQIVYQNETLGTVDPVAANTSVIVTIKNDTFNIKSSELIKSVTLYDLTGRLVEKLDIENTQFSSPFHHAQGIYIVHATLDNGMILNQKLIND